MQTQLNSALKLFFFCVLVFNNPKLHLKSKLMEECPYPCLVYRTEKTNKRKLFSTWSAGASLLFNVHGVNMGTLTGLQLHSMAFVHHKIKPTR